MSKSPPDRRREQRRTADEEHGIVSARIRPGYKAAVIDVSAHGVLVDTEYRLLPGSSVEVRIITARDHASVRGRVVRSAVAALGPSSVGYRGAIRFDRPLPWFAGEDAEGYRVPGHGKRPGHPFRADATPHIV